jgi:hypothetical protein
VRELPVYRRLVAAFDRLFHARYADVEFAPQLPTMLLEAGLVDVTASMYAPIVRGGATERGFLELTLAYLGDRMVDKGLLTQAELDRMAAILRDPRSFHVPMPMVSAWGRRPG